MLMVKIFELEPYDTMQKLLHGESDDESENPVETKNKKRKRDENENVDERGTKKARGKAKYVCPPLE